MKLKLFAIALVSILLSAPLLAQRRVAWTQEHTYTLSGTAAVQTVALSAAQTGRSSKLLVAVIYSSAEVAVTIEQAGTAATSTALTTNALLNTGSATPVVSGFYASNAGAGTVVSTPRVFAGAPGVAIDMSNLWLKPGDQITIRTAATTATVSITLMGEDY